MKQTAVEWLEIQIKNSKHYFRLMKEMNSRGTIAQSNIFEQAKAMEKQQIQNAYDTGEYDCGCNGDSEQYYNKTFKK